LIEKIQNEFDLFLILATRWTCCSSNRY